jgi:hypothetical protein
MLTNKTNGKIKLSLYDEQGDRITKNLSMTASALLDLFKNLETFPSLNISWNNIKPLIFLLTQGVPYNKAVIFLNNPITQMVEENKNELGSDYQLRFAVVKTSRDTFENDIHAGKQYDYKIVNEKGKTIPNQMMSRNAKASQEFLEREYQDINDFKIDFDTVKDFIKDFNEYRRDGNRKTTYDLKLFLNSARGSKYSKLAKDIMAYYSTLVEDGDHFYQMVIKKLDRDAVKYNNKAQIADSQKIERALVASQLLNSDFFEKIKKDSVFAPFYNDQIVNNAINAMMPEFYNKEIPGWIEGVTSVISRITSEIYGSSETKRKIENKIISDLMEFVYKNFYVLNWQNADGKVVHNTLYEFFERDILPELNKPEIRKLIYKGEEVKTDKNVLKTIQNRVEEDSMEFLSGYTLFANQIDAIRAKYPELNILKIVRSLQSRRTSPRVEPEPKENFEEGNVDYYKDDFSNLDQEGPRDVTVSEMFNAFSQVYLMMNLSTDPQTRFVDEQQVRDEWNKFMNFTPDVFPNVYDQIIANGREEIYNNPENIEEIRSFFKLLAYYAMVQNSHLERANGAFAYLAPLDQIKDVVENSLKNFKVASKGWNEKIVANILKQFEETFREMNPDIGLTIPNKGIGYTREKVKSGKLYSKSALANESISIIRGSLLNKAPGELGYNNFLVNPDTKSKDLFSDKC